MRARSLGLLLVILVAACGDEDGMPDATTDAGEVDADTPDATDTRDGSATLACGADIVVLVSKGTFDWSWQNRLATALRGLPTRFAAAGISAHIGVLTDASETVGNAALCTPTQLGAGDGAFQVAGSPDTFIPDFPAGCDARISSPGRNYFMLPDETAEATAALPCVARQNAVMSASCGREPLEALAASANCGPACPGNEGFYRADSLLAVLHVTSADDCTTRMTGTLDGPDEVVLPGSSDPVHSPCIAAAARGDLVPVADLLSEWRATRASGAPVMYTLIAGPVQPQSAVVDFSGMTRVSHGCFRDRTLSVCDFEQGFATSSVPRLGEFVDLLGADGVHVSICTLPGYLDCEATGMTVDPQLDAAVNAFIDDVIARVSPACG